MVLSPREPSADPSPESKDSPQGSHKPSYEPVALNFMADLLFSKPLTFTIKFQ